jgi:hypothetical protein
MSTEKLRHFPAGRVIYDEYLQGALAVVIDNVSSAKKYEFHIKYDATATGAHYVRVQPNGSSADCYSYVSLGSAAGTYGNNLMLTSNVGANGATNVGTLESRHGGYSKWKSEGTATYAGVNIVYAYGHTSTDYTSFTIDFDGANNGYCYLKVVEFDR